MKVMLLWNYYPAYLKYFYKKNINCGSLSFVEHRNKILDDHFGWPGDLALSLERIGIKIEFIVFNAKSLQIKWAEERNFKNWNGGNWQKSILLEQIKSFKPDVLVTANPENEFVELLSEVVGYYKKMVFYLGHRIPDKAILDQADHIITPDIKRVLTKYNNHSKVTYIRNGFSKDVLMKLGRKEKIYDVVFAGNITMEHTRRAEVIAHMIRNGIDVKVFSSRPRFGRKVQLKSAFSKIANKFNHRNSGYLIDRINLPSYRNNLRTIMGALCPQVYGMDYYDAIARSNFCLNVHSDLADGSHGGNMRMYEATGVGTCLLTDNYGTNDELFKNGKEILIFKNKEDIVNLFKKQYLSKEIAKTIGKCGQDRTLANYTIENMSHAIIELFYSVLNEKGMVSK